MNTIVITLHGIESAGITEFLKNNQAAKHYVLSKSRFQFLLEKLKKSNCLTVSELVQKPRQDSNCITFDDGLISDYEVALPLLLKNNAKATFYVTLNNIGKKGYCNKSQLQEMVKAGMEIGSHGLVHEYLTIMSKEKAKQEIFQSKDSIQQIIGEPVYSYAAVGGHFHKWMKLFAFDIGYHSFATMIPGKTNIKLSSGITLYRNHLQEIHTENYILDLIKGKRILLLKNQINYLMLYLPKLVFGMQNYDRIKKLLLQYS